MPKYTPTEDDMDESYAAETPAVTAPESPEDESKETVDQEATEGMTTIVPNKILSPDGEPVNEGDEIVVRVVKNYGDESEIEYAPKEEAPPATESTMTPGNEEAELTALSEQG